MAEAEDPFGSLIKFCKTTPSQELKFQSCSFARESETFPDYFDSLATSSPDPTPLESTGIVIVSPPGTDSENNSSIEKSNTQENEDFLTPPEHHNPSASSSQEDQQRLKPVTPRDSKTSVSVFAETTASEHGRVENEVSVDLGKGEKNLGFSWTEKIDSGDEVLEGQCWNYMLEVESVEGFEGELKRFRVADSELNEPLSKKIRVSEVNWDPKMHTLRRNRTGISDKMNDTEIIDLDTEEIDEEIQFDEGKIAIDVDSPVKDSQKNAEVREHSEAWENVHSVFDTIAESVKEFERCENCGCDGDVDQREKEKDADLDGSDKCLQTNGNLALEESEENTNNEVQRDGKAVSGSSIKKHGKFRSVGPRSRVVDSSIKERVGRGRHELPSSIGGKAIDMGGEESIGNEEEVEKSKNFGSDNHRDQGEKEKGVSSYGGDKCLKVNGILPLAESEEGIRDNSNNKVQRDGKAVLGSCSSSIEKIEKFRYEGPRKQVTHPAKERVARGRRELPVSIRGKEKDMGGEESGGYTKGKNGSWKDLVDALEVVFGKVDDGCEDPDFLETAKRRGLTFPQPRWIDD